MKRIKYEFFKTTKVKDKSNKQPKTWRVGSATFY